MANITFHVPDRDQPMWEAAKRMADRHQTTRYQLVAEAVALHLHRLAEQPSPADRWAAIARDAA